MKPFTVLAAVAVVAVAPDAGRTVQVGQTLWFGTFRGDGIAYRPEP